MTRQNKLGYALRWAVLERDNFTCQYCGQRAPQVTLEVDHIIPVEQGGDDNLENLATSCTACHRGKSALTIQRKHKTTPPRSGSRSGQVLKLLKEAKVPLTLAAVAKTLQVRPGYASVLLFREKRKRTVISPKHGFWTVAVI